jgi:mannosyl-3-phosphoglycerate phosphatase
MAFRIVVTDLDGTLLEHDTYSWDSARPALDRLRAESIPCIFVTSKTRAEVEYWRRETGNTHPFIVENGGALVIPQGYFPAPLPGGATTIEWGAAYAVLVDALKAAAARTGCNVRGFSDMSLAEVAHACALPEEQARLATMREYDEPFVVLDPARTAALRAAIEAQGLRWTTGGRFEHITGDNDKGRAVRALMELYRQTYGDVVSVGLGDGLNDIPLLKSITIPVVIPSRRRAEMMRLVPRAVAADGPGPLGWNHAVLSLLAGQLRL